MATFHDDDGPSFLHRLRERFAEGRVAFARCELLDVNPDAFMDDIEEELGIASAEPSGQLS